MLSQKLILSYSIKIIIQFFQIAVTIVVARVAGASVFGTVAFGLAYVSMFLFIADVGMGTAHIKLISEGKDESLCIGTFSRVQFVLSVIFFIVILSIYLFQKYVFDYKFESKVHEQVILIYIAIVTIQSFLNIPISTFMARTEQARMDIPDLIKFFFIKSRMRCEPDSMPTVKAYAPVSFIIISISLSR